MLKVKHAKNMLKHIKSLLKLKHDNSIHAKSPVSPGMFLACYYHTLR